MDEASACTANVAAQQVDRRLLVVGAEGRQDANVVLIRLDSTQVMEAFDPALEDEAIEDAA